MKPPSPRELMQYADGELPDDRARDVRAWLTADSGGIESAESIAQVGDFVRAYADHRAADFDVVEHVLARIESEPTRASRRRRPVVVWLSVASAGLAAAAAIALLVERPGDPRTAPHTLRLPPAPAESVSGAPAAGDTEEGEAVGASIERLDPGSNGATLFVVQAGAVSTPVVWLLDDRVESGDRMEPL